VAKDVSAITSFRFLGWLVVEIETDTGIVGLGNAALSPFATKAVIDNHLRQLLIGESAFDIEYLWERMYRVTHPFGRKGSGMAAISAIDLALWDAVGKALRQPVFRLLGGRTKEKIPVYASRLYAQPLESFAEEASHYLSQGFRPIKFRFGWGPRDGLEGIARNVALARTLRDLAGPGVEIMGDAFMGWTLDYAKRMVRALEPFGLRWIEEPVLADSVEAYAELRAMGLTPIAGGEHEFTLRGVRTLIEVRAVDVLQIDVNRVGGLTAATKVQALADAFDIPLIPHAGQMHNYHLVMARVGAPMAEYFPKVPVEVGNELFWYVFDGDPVAEEGYISLRDDLPGLGLTLRRADKACFKLHQ
jgi:L-alanine-DL-glutamate epimerase-like enolase superfamily enzyme